MSARTAVAPASATALVSAVIEHARARVEQLHAAVVVTADPARALYRKLGFQPYGLEPRALKVGDQVFDQELLVLRLDGAEPDRADAMTAMAMRPGRSGGAWSRPEQLRPAHRARGVDLDKSR